MSDKHVHRSYLLRLWRGGARSPWRASIQEVTTGEVTHFANIQALLAFIIAETESPDLPVDHTGMEGPGPEV